MEQKVIASKHPTGYSMGTHTVLDGYSHGYSDACGPTVFARVNLSRHGYLRSTLGYSHGTGRVHKGYRDLDTCGPIVFAGDRGVSVWVHLSRNDVKSDFLVAPRGAPDRLWGTPGYFLKG